MQPNLLRSVPVFILLFSLCSNGCADTPATLARDPAVLDEHAQQKKCLFVCKKWGEDCTLNPRTGAYTCRRSCKNFAEECFVDAELE